MARFLVDTDYNTLIRQEIKQILIEDYQPKILQAENMAIAQIKNFLKSKYDIDKIFEAHDPLPNPDPRDPYIVMITLDCTLYHLYSSVAPNLIPEHRSQRYEDALSWLRSVAKNEIIADLPLLEDDNGKVKAEVRIGSKYKTQNHRW